MNNEKNQQIEVSFRVKSLRENLEITISDMAKTVGVSVDDYVAFEEGSADQNFTFLFKCAQRLGVDISEIIVGVDPKLKFYNIVKHGEGMPIKRRVGFDYLHMAPHFKDRFSEPFVVTAKYSKDDESKPIPMSTHKGQEYNYVLSGTLKLQFHSGSEILKAGESAYYDATYPHGMIAVGGQDCIFLSIVIKGDKDEPEYVYPKTIAKKHQDNNLLYKKYVKETVDENGLLTDIDFDIPDNFNFAFDVVDELAKKSPDKVAMKWVSKTGEAKAITFKEMSEYSNKVANYLKSLGVKKGDKVMLVLKRHYSFWYAIMALHKLGAVAIPATNLLTVKDFDYRFNKAGVSTILCTSDGDTMENANDALKTSPTVKVCISVGGKKINGWHSFESGIEKTSEVFNRPTGKDASIKTDEMLMYFTSGTTGYPKIATHDFTYPLGHVTTARWWHNVDSDGLHFTIADAGWAKAVWGKLYGQWLCEAGVFTYDFDKFEADKILPMFAEHKITSFCAPPTMYRFFIKEDLSKYDLSSLKYATVAGEALNPEVFEQFYKATGIKLMEGFGQTEMTVVVGTLTGMTPKPGSMGKPNPQYDVAILTDDGKPAKVGEVGEICIKLDKKKPIGMFMGYYLDDEKTAEVIRDGIYHTGDTAWVDEQGYMWFVGRTDDIIKSSGYRIGPFEIESVIMELPYVLECAVTGVPDEVRGNIVKATIVLTKNTTASDKLKAEIQEYVKTHTAPYKYPRIIEFVDALPKTISGKIRRVEIRENK